MRKIRQDDEGTQETRAPVPLRVGSALFTTMFAGQASVLVLSPILTDVAAAFGVSTAVAGQLRTVSGLAAGITALIATRIGTRVGLRILIALGLLLLGIGSAASAVAPSFAALAGAQVALGVGLAAVLSGSVAAAGSWPAEHDRPVVLSWTLNGQPTAWVVGMPVIGLVAGLGWRLTWVAVPFASAFLASIALRRLPRTVTARRTDHRAVLARVLVRGPVARWALGELLAYSAWSGTLVFAGALFVESYGASPARTGLLLGGAAIAYVPGNLLARRWLDGRAATPLAALAATASIGVAVFGSARPSWWFSAAILALLAFVSGARGFGGGIRGMALAPNDPIAVGSLRAAATQFGYLVGSALGGAALATGGYAGLAAALASMFALAAIPHLSLPVIPRPADPPVSVDPRAVPCG